MKTTLLAACLILSSCEIKARLDSRPAEAVPTKGPRIVGNYEYYRISQNIEVRIELESIDPDKPLSLPYRMCTVKLIGEKLVYGNSLYLSESACDFIRKDLGAK